MDAKGSAGTWAAGYARLFGEHEDGCARRTIEVGEGFHVDLDSRDRVIGVEMLGENQDCGAALVALAMQGRLTVCLDSPVPDGWQGG